MTNDLREKVYKRLGLPFGSLSSESGNDWRLAVEAIEEEEKEGRYKFSGYKKIEKLSVSDQLKQQAADEINAEYRKKIKDRK